MIVQIYEVASSQEAIAVAEAGVDHAGVLVGQGAFPRELSCGQARAIFAALPPGTRKLALSLSGDPQELERVVRETVPDILHIGAALERISPEQTAATVGTEASADDLPEVVITASREKPLRLATKIDPRSAPNAK